MTFESVCELVLVRLSKVKRALPSDLLESAWEGATTKRPARRKAR